MLCKFFHSRLFLERVGHSIIRTYKGRKTLFQLSMVSSIEGDFYAINSEIENSSTKRGFELKLFDRKLRRFYCMLQKKFYF